MFLLIVYNKGWLRKDSEKSLLFTFPDLFFMYICIPFSLINNICIHICVCMCACVCNLNTCYEMVFNSLQNSIE